MFRIHIFKAPNRGFMKLILSLVIFICLLSTGFAQSRSVAVLDMTDYNGETGTSRQLSAERLIRLTGVPYILTDSLEEALEYPIIITGSRIQNNALSASQNQEISDWVFNGGTLITSSMRETDLFNACGISASTSSNTLFELTWDTTAADVFDYINDSLEVKILLGDSASTTTYYSRYYALTTGTSLAEYENGEPALVKNIWGQGTVYTFGPDFRDLTFRSQINADVNANRTYSNGFEPGADVIMLIVRNMIKAELPNAIYKHTIPNKSKSIVMLTHDVDSQTGIDTMFDFAAYESTLNVQGHYNITTRYFDDSLMSDFYNGSWNEVNLLKTNGHTLSSHSVGHFPDYDDDALFPFGSLGNTMLTYTPFSDGNNTAGGTVLGELEVSKLIIETDHSVNVRSFRAGHLVYPDSLIYGLETAGYEFNSTYPANDILSSYPFYALQFPSFSAPESSILEIPMTISDVFHSDPISASNYSQKVATWTEATVKYAANNSPIVLLIHPNRMYKLTAQQDYVNQLGAGVEPYSFEGFGDFWRKRDSLVYTSEITLNNMLVTIEDAGLIEEQSFIIDFDGLDTVAFENQAGSPLYFDWIDWDYNTRLYYRADAPSPNGIDEAETGVSIYPNPSNGFLFVDGFEGAYELIDISGRICARGFINSNSSIDASRLTKGIYLLKLGTMVSRIVIN